MLQPGDAWAERNRIVCAVRWPGARADHAATVVAASSQTSLIYMFGGYRTQFPYPHTHAAGVMEGTASLIAAGTAAHPTLPFYLNDLWVYNTSTFR